MKIRYGFVSNSSTSSFVIFGVKVFDKDVDKFLPEGMDPESEEAYDYKYDKWVHLDGAGFIIGEQLCECEDWGLETTHTSLVDFSDMVANMLKQYPQLDINDFAIHTGSRSC